MMFSQKFAIVLCVVGVVSSDIHSKSDSNDFKVLDSIHDEPPCISQGGLCTLEVDCPKGHLVGEKGLCPAQQRKGVECCYGLSVKETRCQKRGGVCRPGPSPCNKVRIYTEAVDCPKDTTCCILVD